MTKYGYGRVSTVSQELEVQIQALQDENCDVILTEKFTGTTTNRPVFDELMTKIQAGDTLVVTKLDRLARNTKEGIEVIERLFSMDVKVYVLNVGLLENTTMGRFFLTTLLAVAEMERNLIIERMQEGKAIAKQRSDFHEGRPKKYDKKRLDSAMQLLETNSYKEVEAMTGISVATLAREKRKRKANELIND